MKKFLKVLLVTTAVILGVGIGSTLATVFVGSFLESRVEPQRGGGNGW